jgi:dihydrofolate reductase
VADFVAELRQQDGGTIGTAGSPSLVRSLIDQGLLDELTLMVSPVVAGGGRERLFADDAMRGWVSSRVMVSNTNGISAPWQAPSLWLASGFG